jgi:hypothetical protein
VHRVPRSASEHRPPVADPFAAILLEQGSTTRGRRRRTAPAVVSDHHHRLVTLVHRTKMLPSIRGPRHQAKSRPRHRAPLSPQHQSSARNRAPAIDERREAVSPISVEHQQEPTQPGASCWRADPATDSDVHCSPERPFQQRRSHRRPEIQEPSTGVFTPPMSRSPVFVFASAKDAKPFFCYQIHEVSSVAAVHGSLTSSLLVIA